MTFNPIIFVSSLLLAGAVFLGYGALLAFVDRVNSWHIADLEIRFRQLAMDVERIQVYLRWWWGTIIGSFFFFWLVLGMWPVGLLAAVLIYKFARGLLTFLAERQRVMMRDQVVLAARGLANQVRAVPNLSQGLDAVARDLPNPLGRELRRTMAEYNQGTPLTEALTRWKNRLQIDGLTLFITATLVCHERGGKISYALDRIVHSLEESQRVERKREADTASGRLLVTVLALFPFGFLGMFFLLDPDGMHLVFTTLAGQIVLCVIGVLVYVSVRWARRLLAAVD